MNKFFSVVASLVLFFSAALPANAASTTFYLSLKANTCYSYTKTGAKPAPISSNSKSMYAVPCTSPHHFQVIKVGQVPSANATLTQGDVDAFCSAAYVAIYKSKPVEVIKAGARYLRWFYPDPGIETAKYKKLGICIVHKSDTKYSVFSVLNSKI